MDRGREIRLYKMRQLCKKDAIRQLEMVCNIHKRLITTECLSGTGSLGCSVDKEPLNGLLCVIVDVCAAVAQLRTDSRDSSQSNFFSKYPFLY